MIITIALCSLIGNIILFILQRNVHIDVCKERAMLLGLLKSYEESTQMYKDTIALHEAKDKLNEELIKIYEDSDKKKDILINTLFSI